MGSRGTSYRMWKGQKRRLASFIDPGNVQDLGVFMYMLDGQTL